MAKLRSIEKFEQDTLLLHEGTMRRVMTLASGEGKIQRGQALMFDKATGEVKKYVKADGVAPFTVYAGEGEADATSAAIKIEVAGWDTDLNRDKVIGLDYETDFEGVHGLYLAGIRLKEVR